MEIRHAEHILRAQLRDCSVCSVLGEIAPSGREANRKGHGFPLIVHPSQSEKQGEAIPGDLDLMAGVVAYPRYVDPYWIEGTEFPGDPPPPCGNFLVLQPSVDA